MSLTPEEATIFRVSLSQLELCLLADEGILSRQLQWDGERLRPLPEPSPRNTAEAVKSLYALRSRGWPCPLDPDPILDRLVHDYLPALEYPDVALTLWADAMGGGRHHGSLWDAFVRRLPRRASDTMHLAWALSAVCQCVEEGRTSGGLAEVAHGLARRVLGNQFHETGLFHISNQRSGWRRRRVPVATLAAQTYPVQALAGYGRLLRTPQAVECADRCAAAFCRLQGERGQWWRSYHVEQAAVAERLPLYTVNQAGSVPMALDELHAALGDHRYAVHIAAGLGWISGNNEVTESLADETAGTLWFGVRHTDQGWEIVRNVASYQPARCLYWLCSRLRDGAPPVR
jgi:hypothetical protein